jgi:hypothetical protein
MGSEEVGRTVRIEEKVIEVRPIIYSYTSILKISDIKVLFFASLLRAMAALSSFLLLFATLKNSSNPSNYYEFYLWGGLLSLGLLCLFK